MSTLLLRFAAPLQSWGAGSKFDRRDTQRELTKSAVIGLVAAALGVPRDDKEEIAKLGRTLRFGVRVDREGRLLEDLHMAHENGFWAALSAKKAPNQKFSHMTYRYYLSDAVFLAGLEGDDTLLEGIVQALSRPNYPLFLGRRSCPPEGRLCLGVRKGMTVEEALEKEPPLCPGTGQPLRAQTDAKAGDRKSWLQRDVPLSFDQRRREYGFRSVIEKRTAPVRDANSLELPEPSTDHDAISELEG